MRRSLKREGRPVPEQDDGEVRAELVRISQIFSDSEYSRPSIFLIETPVSTILHYSEV